MFTQVRWISCIVCDFCIRCTDLSVFSLTTERRCRLIFRDLVQKSRIDAFLNGFVVLFCYGGFLIEYLYCSGIATKDLVFFCFFLKKDRKCV